MKDKNLQLMDSAPVPKAIMTLAIPTIIGNLISIIYNMTDTFFIGMLNDPAQLGAISLAFPVFLVVQALGSIFANGSPAYVSRCLGVGDYEEARRTSSVAFYGSTILLILVTVCFFIFENPILNMIGTTAVNYEPTKAYLNVIISGAFVINMQIVLPSLLRAEGKVKEAMIGMAIGTITNIVLDPVFLLLFDMGAAGAAWATIIGNLLASVYYIFVFQKKCTNISISYRDIKPSQKILAEILKIGIPSAISQVLMSASNILMNNLAAEYGNNAQAAIGVSGRLLSIVAMIILGFTTGYLPFVGYNYGAKHMKRTVDAFWFALIVSTATCLILVIPFTLLGPAFMRAFSSDPEIIDIGVHCLRIQVWLVPFLGIQFTIMSTFQATGQALKSMVVNLGRQGIFYIPALILFKNIWGFDGIIFSQTSADWVATLLAVLIGIPTIRYFSEMKKMEIQNE